MSTLAAGTSYTGSDLAGVYDFPHGDGAGETVAVIGLGAPAFDRRDVDSFLSDLGSPPPDIEVVRARTSGSAGADDDDSSVTLILEVLASIVPAAHFVLVLGANTTEAYAAALQAVLDLPRRPGVCLMTYGGPEGSFAPEDLDAIDAKLEAAATAGITLVASAGDVPGQVVYPASHPRVLACGATTLAVPGPDRAETAWAGSRRSGTAGGESTRFARPPWQAALGLPGEHRLTPDVAAVGDPQTGYSARIAGKDAVLGGTTGAAAVWAALVTLLNQSLGSRVGHLAPVLYDLAGTAALTPVPDAPGRPVTGTWTPLGGLGVPDGQALLHLLGERQGPRQHVRWLPDEPVGIDRDSLGRRGVAVALESQLREVVAGSSGESFLVLVDGAWGAGKSTLLRFLDELVADPSRQDGGGRRWVSADYDAWRQSRVGPPWLTLLQALRSAVRDEQRTGARRAWFSVRERARLVNAWQWVALALVAGATCLLVLAVLSTGGRMSLARWGDIVRVVGGLVPIVAAVWLVAGFAGRFLTLDSRRSARAFLENRADPMEELAAHFRWVLGAAGRPVLLLIDDLDRCTPAFVIELLDAVQKLMREPHPIRARARPGSLPGVGGTSGVVIVVAADGRWIRQAYDDTYASLDAAVREPGATVGSLFLEKLFQLTLPVPRLPDELRRTYLSALLAEDDAPPRPSAASELADRVATVPHGEVLQELARASPSARLQVADQAIERLVVEREAQQQTRHALERFAPLLEPTPRAMKRFLMAYSVLRAVRTAEGSVVPVGPLALWTIVVTRWPLLAQFLQQDPSAVRLFSVPPERLGRAVPELLAPLFTEPPAELRAVMNHEAGPLREDTIRECCGQWVAGAAQGRRV
jgi:hypothetical protein